MLIKKLIMFHILFSFIITLLPSNVMAKSIFEHQDTTVPANQIVDDVIVVGGDANVSGTINDALIVFNGDVDLKATAKITGMVLVVGGKLHQEHGATVTGEVINISLDNQTSNSLLIGGGLVVGLWFVQLALSILLIIIPTFLTFVLKNRIDSMVQLVHQSFGRIFLTGFFVSLIVLAITILLSITVIGLPIVALLLLFVLILFILGLTSISQIIGERIQGLSEKRPIVVAAGSLITVSLFNIPYVGVLFIIGLLLISLGSSTFWVLEKFRD